MHTGIVLPVHVGSGAYFSNPFVWLEPSLPVAMRGFLLFAMLVLAQGASKLVFNAATADEGPSCVLAKGINDLKASCDISVASGASVEGNANAVAKLQEQQAKTAAAVASIHSTLQTVMTVLEDQIESESSLASLKAAKQDLAETSSAILSPAQVSTQHGDRRRPPA